MEVSELSTHSPDLVSAPAAAESFWNSINVQLDFAIIGAPKCGTTWLHACLTQHPDIYLPPEQNFFTTNQRKGSEHYNGLYRAGADHQLLGDYSNTYMLDSRLPSLLAGKYPGIKIIMLCRDPVKRAFSHYLMDVNLRFVDSKKTSFEQSLAWPVTFSYFDFGLYHRHATQYLEHHDKANVMVAILEEMSREPEAAMKAVYEFLGVRQPETVATPPKQNAWRDYRFHRFRSNPLVSGTITAAKKVLPPGVRSWTKRYYDATIHRYLARQESHKPTMSVETETLLREAYRPENEKLRHLLGKELSDWDR